MTMEGRESSSSGRGWAGGEGGGALIYTVYTPLQKKLNSCIVVSSSAYISKKTQDGAV